MKVRIGLVSNSSSSSYAIPLNNLTAKQLLAIKSHREYAYKVLHWEIHNFDFEWQISIKKDKIIARTDMDNFSMVNFLDEIGVKEYYELNPDNEDW